MCPTGLASLQGGDGTPEYIRNSTVDKTMGIAGALAILAAVLRRERTGRGEAVTVPMFEFMTAFVMLEQQTGWVFDPPIGPIGYPRTASPHRHPYRTKDGFISLLIYTDDQWHRFFRLVDRPGLCDDPRFMDIGARTQNIDELYALVGECLLARTTAEWMSALSAIDVSAGPVNKLEDLFEDEHLTSTGFWDVVEHPTEGRLRMASLPFDFSGGIGEVRPAQRLGQDSHAILAESGFSADEIVNLVEASVTNPALKS